MQNQLQKSIELAKKTGDRLIVFDSIKSNNAYVVMSLEEYEKLTIGKSEVRNLTEDELLDKINRDIAIWKSEQADKENELDNFTKDDNYFPDFSKEDRSFDEISNNNYREEIDNIERKEKKNPWKIPSERKEAAEEIIEEDRQYLEEIL